MSDKDSIMNNMESIIEHTGGCGLFQILHLLSTDVCRFVAIWVLSMMTFGNHNPGWSCENADVVNQHLNQSYWHFNETTLGCSNDAECPNIKFNPNGNSIVSQWDLICDKGWISSFIISLQMVGQFIGSIVAGYIGENLGRKPCLYGSTLIFAVANIAAAFSTSWQMFAALRIVIGIGVSGIMSISLIYTTEFLNSKWRGIVGGVRIANAAAGVFSLVVYFERDWKLVQITTGIVASISLLGFFWISESMRWLAVHGKQEEAKRIAIRIAHYNKSPNADLGIFDYMALEDDKRDSKQYSYLDLFRHRSVRYLTIKLAFFWLFQTIVNLALFFSVTAMPGDFYVNLIIFSVTEVPTVILTGPIINHFGRTIGGSAYFIVAMVACGSAGVVSLVNVASQSDPTIIIIILAVIAKCTLAGAQSITLTMTSELTPTSVRSLGYSFNVVCSNIGAIIAPCFIPGEHLSLGMSLIILAALLFLTSVISLSLPETKGKAINDFIDEDE